MAPYTARTGPSINVDAHRVAVGPLAAHVVEIKDVADLFVAPAHEPVVAVKGRLLPGGGDDIGVNNMDEGRTVAMQCCSGFRPTRGLRGKRPLACGPLAGP